MPLLKCAKQNIREIYPGLLAENFAKRAFVRFATQFVDADVLLDDPHFWLRAGTALVTLVVMAPKPAEALEQHVGRSQLTDKQICIQVHGLLNDLGTDEQATVRTVVPVFAQLTHPVFFQLLSAEKRKTRMQ